MELTDALAKKDYGEAARVQQLLKAVDDGVPPTQALGNILIFNVGVVCLLFQ